MTRRTRRVAVLALVACAALVVTAAATGGAGPAFHAVAAVVCATAATAVHLRLRGRPVREMRSWRWFARAIAALALGYAVETVLGLLEPVGRWGGPGEIVGTAVACGCVYLGVQHWNRYGAQDWDQGERLLGLGGLVGAATVLMYVTFRTGGELLAPAAWSAALVASAAAPTLLVLSLVAVMTLSGLGRDWRAWSLLVLLVSLAVLAVLRYVEVAVHGGTGTVPEVAGVVVWVVVAGTTVAAVESSVVRNVPAQASPRASSIASLAIVVAGVGMVVADVVAPSGHRVVPVAAALSALLGSMRLMRVVTDLSELTSARHEARTDGLTGVPNRFAFMEHLADARRRPRGVGVLLVDLDEFKGINDGLGHAVGDELMRAVASRVAVETAGAATLARLGGDEFALVVDDPDQAERVAQVVLDAIREPFVVAGHPVRIDASIGVASTRHGVSTSLRLLHDADAAMYAAKRDGGGIQVYDARTAASTARRLDLLSDLRSMLATTAEPDAAEVGELVVHFQPQVACDDGRVVGAEALVRWDHPRHGLLPPADFLPLVEEYRMVRRLTSVVLRQAVTAARQWDAWGWTLPVSVNLSASCLADETLPREVAQVLEEVGLPPARLVLEVTESAIMREPVRAVTSLQRLRDRGVRVSIDDYGTGHSSLSYLARLPAHELKLDGSFTAQLLHDERTVTIVAATIELAHRLGIRVTAERVEDDATTALLCELGCDTTQGFVHSRPLPVPDLRDWLSACPAAPRVAPAGGV